MTTAVTPTELGTARDGIGQLRAQVGRLQNFAFRDLISASREELAEAVAALTATQRQVLRLFLTEKPTAPSAVGNRSVAASAPAVRDARRNEWRRSVGLLDPRNPGQATS